MASPSLIQFVQTQVSGSTTVTTGAINTSSGSTFVAAASAGSPPTVTDNKGNTWPASPNGTAGFNPGGGNLPIYLWVLPKGNGGSGHTFTLTDASSMFVTFQVFELQAGTVLDTASLNVAGTATSPFTISTLGQVYADNLILLFGSSYGSATATFNESTGFTKITEQTNNALYDSLVSWQKTVVSRSAVASSQTDTGETTQGYALMIAAFTVNQPAPIEPLPSSKSMGTLAGRGLIPKLMLGRIVPAFILNNSPVTVGLTGVTGTGSVGVLGVTVAPSLTGVTGTGSANLPTVGVNPAALAAVTGTASVGTLTVGVSTGLVGVSGTSSVGVVAPVVTIGLAGVSATGTVSVPGVVVTIGLTGVTGTGSAGTVTASQAGDVTVTLAGVSGTGSVGALGVAVQLGLLGVSATGTVGIITSSGGTPVNNGHSVSFYNSVAGYTSVSFFSSISQFNSVAQP
jgi:hypothetical protein